MHTQLVDELVGTTIGTYEVKQSLGHGRLSAVFLAQHSASPSPVALTLFFFPDHSSSHAHTQFLQRCRSDVYSLGIIVLEMLSGQPFHATMPSLHTEEMRARSFPPPLRALCPDMPMALESLVSRATAYDPARRFQRVSEVAEAFLQIVQDITQRGSATDSKLFAIGQSHGQQNRSALSSSTGTWQIVPPIVTGKLSAVAPTESHAHATTSAQQYAGMKGAEPDSSSAAPATGEQRVGEKPSPFSLETNSPQGSFDSLRYSESASWNAERSWERPTSPKGSKKRVRVKDRRKVLALLATSAGSAVAAFAAVQALPYVAGAVFGQHTSQMNSTPPGSGTQGMQMPGGTQSKMGNMNSPVHQQTPMHHMGTVIGSSNMTPNSSVDFKNPADSKASLLVRLPSGSFVAYEKACTHEQVSVHYDPTTHTLVCPAHGSIFDPARLGAVLQGPATRPLAQVKVRVNADGTITTG